MTARRPNILIALLLVLLALTIPLYAQDYYGGGGGGGTGSLPITGSGATVVADTPLISGTETWNNAGVTFNAMKVNITNTASAAASTLLDLQVGSTSQFRLFKDGTHELGNGKSKLLSAADGDITFTNNAGTTFTQLKFGTGPIFRVENNGFAVYNAGLSAYQPFIANGITSSGTGLNDFQGETAFRGGIALGGNATPSLTAVVPTITSGFGTTPSIVSSNSGGGFSFRIVIGSGGVATSGILAMPTAVTGWTCMFNDQTGGVVTRQSASSTTSVTVTGASAWGAGALITALCAGF